jgi:hypothetical protein
MQATMSGYPYPAVCVFFYTCDIISKGAIGTPFKKIKLGKAVLAFIIPVKAEGGANPDIAFAVLVKKCGKIITQRVWISRDMQEVGNFTGITVQDIQTFIGRNPDIVFLIFKQGIDRWIAESVGSIIDHKIISVILVKAVPGPDPDKSL